MKRVCLTNSPYQTKKLGEKLARKILKTEPQKSAFVIGLIGDLGGGKTTFLQGFARFLGISEKILSPTFVILKCFKITKIKNPAPKGRGSRSRGARLGLSEAALNKIERQDLKRIRFKNFYHFDCYRIKRPKELLGLGFKEIVSDPQNIVVIEWAEKIKDLLPENTLIVRFEFISKQKRKVIIENLKT